MQNPKQLESLFVIFSGYNQRAVVAFLRTLEEYGVSYAIIASSPRDTILKSSYSNKVFAVRKKKQLDTEEIESLLGKIKIQNKEKRLYIAPSTEALNRYLLKNRSSLESMGYMVPLVGEELYVSVSDKHSFGNICQDFGLSVPRTVEFVNEKLLPLVAKPKVYCSTDGSTYSPVLLKSPEDYSAFLETHSQRLGDFYFQEYIEGTSYYLLFYRYKHGEVVALSQRNYIQQPEGKSILAAEIVPNIEDEIEKYKQLLDNIEYRGLIMIELRKGIDGTFYMIEANPRFWGPSQLFVDYGINLFAHFLYDWGAINQEPNGLATNDVKYFWSGGIKQVGNIESLTYYDYEPNKLVNDWDIWFASDVYNRIDTKNLTEEY